MNTTQGADLRASANSSLMRAAPRPTYSSTNSEALTARGGEEEGGGVHSRDREAQQLTGNVTRNDAAPAG